MVKCNKYINSLLLLDFDPSISARPSQNSNNYNNSKVASKQNIQVEANASQSKIFNEKPDDTGVVFEGASELVINNVDSGSESNRSDWNNIAQLTPDRLRTALDRLYQKDYTGSEYLFDADDMQEIENKISNDLNFPELGLSNRISIKEYQDGGSIKEDGTVDLIVDGRDGFSVKLDDSGNFTDLKLNGKDFNQAEHNNYINNFNEKMNNLNFDSIDVREFVNAQFGNNIHSTSGFIDTKSGEKIFFELKDSSDNRTEPEFEITDSTGKKSSLTREQLPEGFYDAIIDNKPENSGGVRYSSIFNSRFCCVN